MSAAVGVVQVPCKVCEGGLMARRKEPRFGTALAVIGGVVSVISGLGLIVAAAILVLFLVSGAQATAKGLEAQKERTSTALETADVPQEYRTEYSNTSRISDASLARMDPELRKKVERIMSTDNAGTAGRAIGVGIGASLGIGLAALLGIPSLPFFLLGLLFVVPKKVWKCEHCSSVTPAS